MPAEPPRPTASAGPFRPATPVVIGIVGGIASGKSTVARLFAAHGLRHVDADAHSRAIAAEPATLRQLVAAFGPAVVADGTLDRTALARIAFDDPAARRRLEAILLPSIRQRILADMAAAKAAGESVLLDAPLLLEAGLVDLCDHVVFVDADPATRARRAAARGWSTGELERREAAQAPVEDKERRAGFRIHNDADLVATERQVADLLRTLALPTP